MDLLDGREFTTPPPTVPPTDDNGDDDIDDDDNDDDDDDDRRGPELIHRIRGSCGIVAAYGTYLFANFPEGPVEEPVAPLVAKNFTKEIKTFLSIVKLAGSDKTVYLRGLMDSIGAKILHYQTQCPALKLQQFMVYILRLQLDRLMREENGTMYGELMTILEPVFGTEAAKYAEGSVKFIHKFLFEEIIDNIMENELGEMKTFIRKFRKIAARRLTVRVRLPLKRWIKLLGAFMKKFNRALQCPTKQEVLDFHVGQSQRFRERFTDDIIENQVVVAFEELIKENMPFPPGSDPKPTIDAILTVLKKYIRDVLYHYNRYEQHIKGNSLYQMEPFFAKMLSKD
ncbi:hypothetical protein FSP39_014662 [Pinctada imbricata]|uniref:Uncharacterized protein n=1 Tax=Pinctada imbricata TaxID=66713 RepID=A0AA88Y9E4_PINIB|nr:hypothetical protein FSP39_014662 [Pinctada imbricata]